MRAGIWRSLLVVALVALVWIGCDEAAETKTGGGAETSASGSWKTAPGFDLKRIDDNKSLKLSDYKGKVVLVDFWATWCPPCRMSIPHLVDLQNKYGSRGFQVLGISLDRGGVDVVRKFVQKYKINYPVMMSTPDVLKAYGGVRSIPQAFLIDRQGRIRETIVGYRPLEELQKKVEAVL